MEAPQFKTIVNCLLAVLVGLAAMAAYRPVHADTLAAVIGAENAALTLHPSLDIDVSATATKYDALTDGLLAIRYLFGLTGASLTTGALGGTAWRTNAAEIDAYLDGIGPTLDIDGNGHPDALTDGLMFLRYLFGLRGSALISNAVGTGATRTTATQIEEYMRAVMP